MVTLTWKFTVIPTQQQEEVLWKLSETCRLLYNYALAERKYLYDTYNHCVTYREQQNALPQLKKLFPRYNQVYSKVLQMTLKKLDAAYKSFFGLLKNRYHTARSPTFRGKNYFFTLCYNQSGFTVTKQTIRFSHKHPCKTELIFPVPFDFSTRNTKQIEIFQDQYDKRFYLAVTFEHEDPPFIDNGLYQAFDLGTTKHTAVNIHGRFLESTVKRPDKYWEPKIRSLQQRRDHCKQGSRRHRLFTQRLATIKWKCRNQTMDWQHKQSINFLRNTKARTIVVGDLSPQQMVAGKKNGKMTERRKFQKSVNRGVHNTGHLGRFIELLTYKVKKIGKRATLIDEQGTTKTCSVCGHIKERMSLSERIYQCEMCGIVRDRDQNSAINIMKRFLSHNALWTGYQYFLSRIDNLRYTVNGKTKVSHHLVDDGFGELVGSHLL
ncbi:MAG: RNA-guided endonuclease InsQ/TnpB family protein [Candidatus Hodarchaeota archaeon]